MKGLLSLYVPIEGALQYFPPFHFHSTSFSNVRLIAAASELLAACQEAIFVLEFAKRQDPGQAGLYHCPSVRQAISHATTP